MDIKANIERYYNVSASGQMNYLLHHKLTGFVTYSSVSNYAYYILLQLYEFSMPPYTYQSQLLTILGILFMGMMFLYPNKSELSTKSRIGVLAIIIMIFLGTFSIQLFTWSPVGNLNSVAIQARYFIPLLGLLPFVFGLNNNSIEYEKINKIMMVMINVLLAGFIMLTVCKCY